MIYNHMGVSKNSGTPKWMEYPIKMDDLGVPLFSETSILIIPNQKAKGSEISYQNSNNQTFISWRNSRTVVRKVSIWSINDAIVQLVGRFKAVEKYINLSTWIISPPLKRTNNL